ncbi:protein-export membrane protein SecF [Labrys miyagiensis]
MRHLRIVPDNTKFGFIRFRRFSFPTSAVLSILALVLFFTHGLNYGIDFKGGIALEITAKSGQSDVLAIRSQLEPLQLGEIQMQEFGNKGQVLVRVAQQPGGDKAQQDAAERIKTTLGEAYQFDSIQVIGPSVSQELVTVGTVGIFVAILGILIYLWFRFDWQFAVGAMIANVHDIVLTIGFMSVTQIDFDLTSVAALLTILGYSLNDTVVIYDRIRELLRKYKKKPMDELLDESINATLSRSVITHVTVALALLALLIFGGHAIHSFTATMLFGVVLVGTYTSIFIASPVLIYLGLRPGSHEGQAAGARDGQFDARAAE